MLVDPTGLAAEGAPLVAGAIPMTTATGATIQVQILKVSDGKVQIKYTIKDKDGSKKTITTTKNIKDFSDEDQGLLSSLQNVPDNITIDPSGLSNQDDKGKSFVKNVADGITKIGVTKTGTPIIDGIKASSKPPSLGKDTQIVIVHTDKTLDDGDPDSWVDTNKSPTTDQLVPTASPKIHFNPDSGTAVLGKELWHAWQQLIGATVPNVTKWDSDAGPEIRDPLKKELDKLEKMKSKK